MADHSIGRMSNHSGEPQHSPELFTVLEEMTWTVIKMINARQGLLYLSEPDGDGFIPLLALGNLNIIEKQTFASEVIDPTNDLLANMIRSKRKPLVLIDRQIGPLLYPSIASTLEVHFGIAVPLEASGILYGLLLLTRNEDSRQFNEEEIRMARSIANAMGLALENVRLYEETSRRLNEEQSFHEISRALLQKLDLTEVLEVVCTVARRLTSAMGSLIALMQDDGELKIAYQCGESHHPTGLIHIENTRFGLVLQKREPIIFNQKQSSVSDLKTPSNQMLVPMIVNQEIIGVLDVVDKRFGFTQEDVRVMKVFADQVAVAVEHARLYNQAEKMAVLEERQRLARELHDSANQALYAINLLAGAAARQLSAGNLDTVRKQLKDLRETAQEALAEMRLMIFELRPPAVQKLGLANALETRLKSVEERTGVLANLEVTLSRSLPQEVEDGLYRIAQEALNNVLKHAGAQKVSIIISQTETITHLMIMDDGRGFNPLAVKRNGGLGLKSMKERAIGIGAEISIDSRPGEGTIVSLEIKA